MNMWPTNDQYNMMNMPMNNMMQPNSMQQPNPMQPGMANMGMMSDWNQMNPMMNSISTAGSHSGNFVPPLPIDKDMGDSGSNHNENQGGNKRDERHRRGRSSERNRDRNDHRGDRSRSDRRERRSKWSDNDKNQDQNPNNNMMMNNMVTGNMMPYTNMMDMQSMPNMNTMSNMQMNPMMPAMPMMTNMMDQNQMMMLQMQMMGQQVPSMPLSPIYISNGVLLPPVPGMITPPRRDRPPGCRTIFIGGIPKNITKNVITEIFQRFGPIFDVQIHRQGISHVRFENPETVELSFFLSGYRYKLHGQSENEATTLFIDYALNHDDQNEFEKNKGRREPTPPRVEPFSPQSLEDVTEKIKSDTDFAEAAPTLAFWLERGECNKKNANAFYSLIQSSNNQVRRLYNEKMTIDEEFQNTKQALKEKFSTVITQFEQVAKILSAAKHQRVSDHFSKQQRRNIEMWFKMTEDLENIKEEFHTMFDEHELETDTKNMIPLQKYEQLRKENEGLIYELEGYKNEAHLAKDEAERKFEKYKAQFIAQQALINKDNHHKSQAFPPLPLPPLPPTLPETTPLPTSVPELEAKIISVLTAYLLAQPLGASLENLVSYVKSIIPSVSQVSVSDVLGKYPGLFNREFGGNWVFVTFDIIKKEKAS